MRPSCAMLWLLLALVPGSARAQGWEASSARAGSAYRGGPRWIPFVGVRYSNVQGFDGSVLFLRNTSRQGAEYGGGFAAAEVGVHGWSASLGKGRWGAESGGSLRATFLQTYGNGGRLAPHQSYLGGEARVSLVWGALGVGWYHRVAGQAPGDGSIFAFTVGFGY